MYAKLKDGKISQFPYTIGQLRKDNPNVSFPKHITQGILQKYGIVGVVEGPQPQTGPYQRVQRDAMPTRPVIGQYTEEDAPMPEMVGEDILAGYWMIGYSAVDMFSDTTDEEGVVTTKAEHEAAYQAGLDAKAAEAVRKERDSLLADTDWRVIKAYETGANIPAEWEIYRQALRDITGNANFPHLSEEDWPVKPE